MVKGIAEATTKIYEQLESLAPEERRRAVEAALIMLGEPSTESRAPMSTTQQRDEIPGNGFPSSVKTWIRKNKLEDSSLEEMFHFDDGKVRLILGSAIGKSKRQQTVNTYLLAGVAAYLETGAASFADETARDYCRHLGCYDQANHHNYIKALQNRITGSKAGGWTLTAPGLRAAAELISSGDED